MNLRKKSIKYLFFALFILAVIFIIANFWMEKSSINAKSNYTAIKDKLQKSKSCKLPENYTLNINKSVFEGLSNDLSPYTIYAQNVIKNSIEKYLLSSIDGIYVIDGEDVQITAGKGTLYENKKSIMLQDNVEIFFNGILVNSDNIMIDFETRNAKSKNKVEVLFDDSRIEADQFETHDSSKIIKFKGNVNSNLDF
jgi:hypothetical protein